MLHYNISASRHTVAAMLQQFVAATFRNVSTILQENITATLLQSCSIGNLLNYFFNSN